MSSELFGTITSHTTQGKVYWKFNYNIFTTVKLPTETWVWFWVKYLGIANLDFLVNIVCPNRYPNHPSNFNKTLLSIQYKSPELPSLRHFEYQYFNAENFIFLNRKNYRFKTFSAWKFWHSKSQRLGNYECLSFCVTFFLKTEKSNACSEKIVLIYNKCYNSQVLCIFFSIDLHICNCTVN